MDYGSTENIPKDACRLRQRMEIWQYCTEVVD